MIFDKNIPQNKYASFLLIIRCLVTSSKKAHIVTKRVYQQQQQQNKAHETHLHTWTLQLVNIVDC